ncbi:acyltransferase [Chitinivorax sp. B]|uniref:acyltransferase n=1 Tax=Chitinivorax sp. B TaxID=2502235 RepID=UPI0010FA2F78|nr:acyltransferase [Chitinivorax sp. B]
MRKITLLQILSFVAMLTIAIVGGIAAAVALAAVAKLTDFRGVGIVIGSVVFTYLIAILLHRLFLWARPLPMGEIAMGSPEEATYHIYLLFYLVLFYPITRSAVVPVPLMRLFYQMLGAKLGDNSYSSGIIFDPKFVTVGNNCILGQGSLIIPHAIEGASLSHQPITMGNNVTIGANAVILQGCVIEDGATVGIGAVVSKNSHIKQGEIWLGIPAKPYQPKLTA